MVPGGSYTHQRVREEVALQLSKLPGRYAAIGGIRDFSDYVAAMERPGHRLLHASIFAT